MLRVLLRLLIGLGWVALCAGLPGWAVAATPWGPAQWVWDTPAGGTDSNNDPRYMRYAFDLPAAPTKAEVVVSVDNVYELLVNGEKIGGHTAWAEPKHWDIAKQLHPGKNVVALVAKNDGGSAGAIVWGEITLPDKKTIELASGPKWRVSLEAAQGWNKPEFDDLAWSPAAVLGPSNMPPWNLGGGGGSQGPKDGKAPPSKPFQDADKELADFIVEPDFKVELVAGEPLVVNPVSLALDEKGRIYYGESHTYRWGPQGSPYPKPTNPIVLLDPLPDGKGYQRVVVAEGFDDPVMGLLVRDGKLWATSTNFLYLFDIDDQGHTSNRRTMLLDKEKAWNPFGMFVLEWGPDGMVYMSVGNHNIDIGGPNNRVTSRGGSGIVVRMKPDGSDMERMVQGLRVPYSFEYDPFGQLWLLSNGEGNPNRFVRVIEGVDYHCYSRGNADGAWLAGNHPLAPPCFELPGGANTQLLHYYGAAFPLSWQGNQFLVNWGRHGFPSANHTIYRYVPDERGNIVDMQSWLTSSDPHFRPTAILLAPDGNMLVADWYGSDDENDKTGRIWKVSYVGNEPTGKTESIRPEQWTDLAFAIASLGSAYELRRELAMQALVARGQDAIAPLAKTATGGSPLGSAEALWTLTRIGTPEALAELAAGTENSDWRVRRLALRLMRRFGVPQADAVAAKLAVDSDPAVKLEAALTRSKPADRLHDLVAALNAGAAEDAHLRYEAAWHVAANADDKVFGTLLSSADPNVRLAGLIAIDVALWEKFDSRSFAEQALATALANPGEVDPMLLIKLADMNRSPALVAPLQALIARPGVSTDLAVHAILLLRTLAPAGANNLGDQAGANLLAAMRTGRVPIKTVDDALVMLQLLPIEGPTEFSLQKLGQYLFERNDGVRSAAHATARMFGVKSAPLAPTIWQRLLAKGLAPDEKAELITTLVAIEAQPDAAKWAQLLKSPEPAVVREAVRAWRRFKGNAGLAQLLVDQTPELVKADKSLAGDLAAVLNELKADPAAVVLLGLPPAETDKAVLAKDALAKPASPLSVALGRQVFVRATCVKCHNTTGSEIKIGPPLTGIGRVQKPEYLIESILEPSKIIKTGFETETIQTTGGQVFNGLVREHGDELEIIEADRTTRLPKAEVEERHVQKKSLMPEGIETQLSADELADLLACVVSLKVGGPGDAAK